MCHLSAVTRIANGIVDTQAGELALAQSVCMRVPATVLALTSATLLAACATMPPDNGLDGKSTAVNPNTSAIVARGWQLPNDNAIDPGKKNVAGAHAILAIDPPDDELLETADIPTRTGQAGQISLDGATADAPRKLLDGEEIVRSRID